MPDMVTTFFSNYDVFGLILSLGFMMLFFVVGLKKNKIPLFLGLLNFILIFMILTSQSLISSIYTIILVMSNAFLTTSFVNKVYLGTHYGSEAKIFLSYLVFFSITFFLLNYINLTTTVFSGSIKSISKVSCNLGIFIVDGLFTCAYNWLQYFFGLLFFSSSIGILNAILIIPFLYFIGKYIADWLRGRSGG